MIGAPSSPEPRLENQKSKSKIENARVTTADAEQTAVAAFLPWRGS
jgi:hypothetical protein